MSIRHIGSHVEYGIGKGVVYVMGTGNWITTANWEIKNLLWDLGSVWKEVKSCYEAVDGLY